MKLINNKDAIDIPDELIKAHLAGNVVFFCGAGISMGAGYPSFKGLTEKIFADLHTTWQNNPHEQKLFKQGRYDELLSILENDIGRETLHQVVYNNLKIPDEPKPIISQVHADILKLACTNNNKYQLVTTNFDLLFEQVIEEYEKYEEYNLKALNIHKERPLPLINQRQLNDLVYLHGALPKTNTFKMMDIILTGADFGRAYLVESWATEFLLELVQNYTICFIGYSLNDPIMRYFFQAILKLSTEKKQSCYIFTDDYIQNWQLFGIEPICYKKNEQNKKNKHAILYETVNKWCEYYTTDILNKISDYTKSEPEQIKSEYCYEYKYRIAQLNNEVKLLQTQSNNETKFLKELFDKQCKVAWLIELTKSLTDSEIARLFIEPYCCQWFTNKIQNCQSLANEDCESLQLWSWLITQSNEIRQFFHCHYLESILIIKDADIKERWLIIINNPLYKEELDNKKSDKNKSDDPYQIKQKLVDFNIDNFIESLEHIIQPYLVIDGNYLKIINKFITKMHGITINNYDIQQLITILDIINNNINKYLYFQRYLNFETDPFSIISCIEECKVRKRIYNNYETSLIYILEKTWNELNQQNQQLASTYLVKYLSMDKIIFIRFALYACKYNDLIQNKVWIDSLVNNKLLLSTNITMEFIKYIKKI